MDRHLVEFIECFNSRRFFEAHEVLEELWIESEGEAKDFYKGLIQCAVAFVHLQRNNFRGAKKVFGTSCGYLKRYLPVYEEVNTQVLLEQFERFFSTVARKSEETDIPIDWDSASCPMISTGHR